MKIRRALFFIATVCLMNAAFAGLNDGYLAVSEQNFKKAFAEFEPLAKQGNADAQFALGSLYFNGFGIPQNLEKAKSWYMLSAEQGNDTAQLHLGTILHNQKKNEEALYWYTKSANNGNARAQTNLGKSYSMGILVEVDQEKAVQWYLKAAQQGYAEAQFLLAKKYLDGEGVSRSLVDAYAWFSVAETNGFQAAAIPRKMLSKGLNADDLNKGQAMASAYFEKYQRVIDSGE